MTMIKVGDRVVSKEFGIAGVVTRVKEFNPKNPIEEHGTIEVKIDESCPYYDLAGDDVTGSFRAEHFAHYQWENYLTVNYSA